MKIASDQLISDLSNTVKQHIAVGESYRKYSEEHLNWRASSASWSVYECLEHLSLYGDFYLIEFKKRIAKSRYRKPDAYFKSGWLGNYFANSMLPREKLNKMKTFKDKDPGGSTFSHSTLDRFINQQRILLELLEEARLVNLNRTKTDISIGKIIKLKLGDTFRFVINHNIRHIEQAERTLENAKDTLKDKLPTEKL